MAGCWAAHDLAEIPGYDGAMPMSVILVLASFTVMAIAWLLRHRRQFHIPLMSSVMAFDFVFPVYLYMTHDWFDRLIEKEELFSFAIWAHLILVLGLYALYVMQIQAGKQMLAGDDEARQHHLFQGRGILLVRLFVFLSGALLIESEAMAHTI